MIELVPTILLVRHAQASFGSTAYDVLSRRGIEQAEMLALDLARRGVRIQRIATGTLARQRDTAAPIAAASRAVAPVGVDRRWDEFAADAILDRYSDSGFRLEHASAAGHAITQSQFQDVLDDAMGSWVADDASAVAFESWPAFYERVGAALDDFAGELASGETAVACTSGGVVAAVCIRLLGLPSHAFLQLNRVAVNTGITKVVCGRRGLTLISFNEHAHLERDGHSLVTYR